MVVQRVAVQTVAFKEGCDPIGPVNGAGEEQQCAFGVSSRTHHVVCRSEIMGRRRVVGVGETRCLNTRCRLWRYAGSADGHGRRRRPWEARFVEVHVR
eukprot:3956675-Pleurochrysis_carterae.AAC.2